MNVRPSYQATDNADHPKMVITKKNRKLQLAKLYVIAFVSIGTVALTIIDVTQTAKLFDKKNGLTHKIKGSIETAMVIHELQKERGMTALQFGFRQLNLIGKRIKLQKIRRKTNQSIAGLQEKGYTDLKTKKKKSFLEVLEDFRRKIDQGSITIFELLHTYRKWIINLLATLTKYVESENLEDYANLVYAYEMVILSKEEAGMERALGGLKFIQGKNFSIVNTTWYNEKRVLAQNYLDTAFLFSNELKALHTLVFANSSRWIQKIEKNRKALMDGSYNKSSNGKAYEWFALMTRYNNLMLELQKRQAILIEAKVDEEIEQSTNHLVIRSLLLCFTLVVVPCIVISLARVQKSYYDYTLSLFDKVGLEQARTDFLIRQNEIHVDNLAEKWKGFSKNAASIMPSDGAKNPNSKKE